MSVPMLHRRLEEGVTHDMDFNPKISKEIEWIL